MPAIGAEVADAYIEVHADTGPFRRELRREATLAARAASDDFGTEFTKAIDRDLDPLGARIAESLREMGELGGRGLIDEIADQVRTRAERINTAFAQSITFGDFAPFIESFNDFDDAIEDFDTRLRELNRDGTLTNETFDRLNSSFNAYVRTLQDGAIADALARDRDEAVKFEKANERLVESLDESRDSARRFSIGLGSLKGSRNDFLNFIGSLSGFLERNIGRGLQGLFTGIGSGVSALGRSLADVDGPLGSVGRNLDKFGGTINKLGAGGLDGLLVQLAALSISIQLLIAASGPIASVFSGLLGAFTALTVGVGGALLGGLLALGPALTAIAAGGAAVALGFSKLDKAQKAVFDPLKDLFNEVRASVQERLFDGLGGQVDALVAALAPIGPFLTNLAGVFADWVAQVVSEIGPDGPLAATFSSLGEDLPGIFRTLLDLISVVGGSLAGLFAGAAPGAERLFEGITGVVEQFSAWVNTAAGQEAINGFMQEAVDILTILWDIAKQVGIALGELWGGGAQDAAATLLGKIQELATEFAEWLGDTENRQALIDFFNNGIAIAEALGGMVGMLVNLFNALDNSFTRLIATNVINFLSSGIGVLVQFANFTNDVTQNIIGLVGWVVSLAGRLGNLMGRAAQAGSAFRAVLGAAFTAVGGFIQTLIRGFQSIVRPMQVVGSSGQSLRINLVGALSGIASAASTFIRRAISSLGEFASSAGRVAASVGDSLRGVASTAANALGSFVSAIARGVDHAVSELVAFGGRAVNALSGLPGRFVSLGSSIIGGVVSGISGAVGGLLNYVNQIADQIAATFADALDIFSPSRVFRGFGEDITAGLALGIEDGNRMVANAVDGLLDTTVGGNINAPISSLANQAAISSGLDTAPGFTAGNITVVTPFANPRLVALEVMDALAARGK